MAAARAFSLLELLIVMVVAIILTGILLPSLSQVRESVNQVFCSSNMRQLGMSTHMYVKDYDENLPYSRALDVENQPRDLQIAHHDAPDGWDGLGLLFADGYCAAVDCFYCPSHRGDAPLEAERPKWNDPTGELIVTNFHYAGHLVWDDSRRRRRLDDPGLVLMTDGLRTSSDLNHETGMNMLRADGSVRWYEDGGQLHMFMASLAGEEDDGRYRIIWDSLEDRSR